MVTSCSIIRQLQVSYQEAALGVDALQSGGMVYYSCCIQGINGCFFWGVIPGTKCFVPAHIYPQYKDFDCHAYVDEGWAFLSKEAFAPGSSFPASQILPDLGRPLNLDRITKRADAEGPVRLTMRRLGIVDAERRLDRTALAAIHRSCEFKT